MNVQLVSMKNKIKAAWLPTFQRHHKLFNPIWRHVYWPIFGHNNIETGFQGDKKEIFTQIHSSNFWSCEESISGPGSTLAYTKPIRKEIGKLVVDLRIEKFLDAPCGDCNWISHIRFPAEMEYIGCDIVPALIEKNRTNRQFRHPIASTSFREFDITKDTPPEADIWLCRDVLFHLPTQDIMRVIENFKKSGIRYFAATTFPHVKENSDVGYGGFRQLNLTRAPFNLPKPIRLMEDFVIPAPPRMIGVWSAEQLR